MLSARLSGAGRNCNIAAGHATIDFSVPPPLVGGVLCSLMAIAIKIEFEWFFLKQLSSDRGHQAYYRFRILESSCHPTPLR
jgi:hypothetical protein